MTVFNHSVKNAKMDEGCSNAIDFHSGLAHRLHARYGYAPATANALADAYLLGKGGRHEWS